MKKVIEVNHLNFGYDEKLILKDISFSIDQSDFLGIIGSNGSGKSTLVKLLLKILSPTSGEIKILGKDIQKFNEWGKIGYVSQKATSINASFPATVEEIVGANLFPQLGLFRNPNKLHKEMIYQALDIVGMKDNGKRLIGNLSGGQQQRVFIARVLVNQPQIMFLDEPTAGVDAKSEEAVYCLLARLNKELGITVIMVSHDISAITVHANKLLCMGENGMLMHNPKDAVNQKLLSDLYGYGINMHLHQHECLNCEKRRVRNA